MKKLEQACTQARQHELKRLLKLIAERTTERGTLTELAHAMGTYKYTLSRWIRLGEVPPRSASALLKMEGVNPPTGEKIELQDLTPSLF